MMRSIFLIIFILAISNSILASPTLTVEGAASSHTYYGPIWIRAYTDGARVEFQLAEDAGAYEVLSNDISTPFAYRLDLNLHPGVTTYKVKVKVYAAGDASSTELEYTSIAYTHYVRVAEGCTTAYFIDQDCDGYGVGMPYLTGPDADDTDETVNTRTTAEEKYGSFATTANVKSFFCTARGAPYCNIQNIWYVTKTGNDATGAINDAAHPYLTIAAAMTDGYAAGDMVLIGAGSYTDYLTLTMTGVPGDGVSSTEPNIVAAMPGESAIILGDGTHHKWLGTDNWYWAFDGLQMGATDSDTVGYGYRGIGSHFFTFTNIFMPRNVTGMEIMTGNAPSTCKENISVTEDLDGDGDQDTRNLVECYCPNNISLDRVVVYGSTGIIHNFYFGCNRLFTTRDGVFAHPHLNRVISYHSKTGWSGFQINGNTNDLIIENSIVHSNSTNGINLEEGVWNSTIKNNVIFNNGNKAIHFYIYKSESTTWTGYSQDNLIVNNTIYVGRYVDSYYASGDPSQVSAIKFQNDASAPEDAFVHNRNIIRNNILLNYGASEPPIMSDRTDHLTRSYIQNNILYATNGSSSVAKATTTSYTLAQFQAAYANSTNNINASPGLTSISDGYNDEQWKFDFSLTSSSPGITHGLTTSAPSVDIRNVSRGTYIDIGAYEWESGTTPPAKPTGVVITP